MNNFLENIERVYQKLGISTFIFLLLGIGNNVLWAFTDIDTDPYRYLSYKIGTYGAYAIVVIIIEIKGQFHNLNNKNESKKIQNYRI